MKKIFDFSKKKQFPPFPPFKLPYFFGVQTSNYIPGYLIKSKDLPKFHKAALLGDVGTVQLLLMFGKNSVNEVDRENRTCLHLACANGHLDIVTLLIERKCELNLLDKESRTPFMKAIQCEKGKCATILLQHGADPNLGDGKNNALHYVAFYMDKDLAAKLLHYKADIEAKNKEGLTPLFFAIRGLNYDMAEFLLKNGANVNALDGSKRTTLMVAVSMQYTEMVSLLLEYNVDHTIKDQIGRTAEAYAKIYNYPLLMGIKSMSFLPKLSKEYEFIEYDMIAKLIPVIQASLPRKACKEKLYWFATHQPPLGIVEISTRLFEKPRSDDPCPSTKDELNFEMEKFPKLKLTKAIKAAQHMTKISKLFGEFPLS